MVVLVRRVVLAAIVCAACGPKRGGATDGDSTASTAGPAYVCEPAGDASGETGEAALCGERVEFVASHQAWRAALADNDGCYHYTVPTSASGIIEGEGPADCWYRTTVIVASGVVVERRFEPAGGSPDPSCEPGFVEVGDQVGAHDSWYAARPVTVDALYAACCTEVLQLDPDEYSVVFDVDDHGWIRSCYAWPLGCSDDCGEGPFGQALTLDSLQFGLPD